MEDKDLKGRLVYLTVYIDRYLREVNPEFNVPMANRLAKVIKVFDWDTEEGKLLLDVRSKSKKWNEKYNKRDYKFVLKIYYPDLMIKNRTGVTVEEVLPRMYPGTKHSLFELVPDWMHEDIIKEEKEAFFLDKKDISKRKRPRKKPDVS